MRRGIKRLFDFWWGQGIADDVPSLTYYLVLSVAPFALGVAAVEALLLDDKDAAIQVAQELNRFLPTEIHDDVVRLVDTTRDDSIQLLVVAIASMLWTTSGAIGVIERCESRILDEPRHSIVVGRIRNILLGLLVATSVAVGAASSPVIGDAIQALDFGESGFPAGLTFAVNALGSIIVFALVYRLAPRRPLRWRSALLGALPAGVGIQLIPTLVGLYVGAAAGIATGAVLLVIAVVLLGLYLMAACLLIGAGIATVTDPRGRLVADERGFSPLPGTPES